jgi:hypothetical protein
VKTWFQSVNCKICTLPAKNAMSLTMMPRAGRYAHMGHCGLAQMITAASMIWCIVLTTFPSRLRLHLSSAD